MAEIVNRARSLVGKSRDEYQCNHVVNYAVNGNKNVGGLASTWAAKPGKSSGVAGDVIVGTDGVHCGIFTGDTIIHSSSSKHEVIEVPASQAKYLFPKGHKFVSPK